MWDAEKEYYLEQLTLPSGNQEKERMIENVLDFHDDDKKNAYPKKSPNINIGLGSGMLCKTLFIAMDPKYRIQIRNLQMTDRQISNHNKRYVVDFRGNQLPVDWSKKLSPNSRHLIFRQNGKYSNAYRPLGWANFQFGAVTYEDNVL